MFIHKTKQNYEAVLKLWKIIGLEDDFFKIQKMNDIKNNISSGQEIMILFSRAILNNPDILILDEIDKNISSNITKKILHISKNSCDKLIIVSHINSNLSFINKKVLLK